MEKYTKRKFNICVTLFILFSIALLCGALAGCVDNCELEFSVESISLAVGERRDIFPYAKFTPSMTDDKNFTLTSDSDCVTVDGTTVTAVSSGTARLTAFCSGGSATLVVSCAYAPPQALYISVDGSAVQTAEQASDIAAVRFSAEFDGRVDPDIAVLWSVNGVRVSDAGNNYEFTPSGYGEFTVRASADGVFDERVVKIYRPSSVEIGYEGELNQVSDFSPVRFFVTETTDSRNPRSVYSWRVNGKFYSAAAVFDFTPQAAGEYEVSARVNGVDYTPVTVTATGLRAPSATVVFDDEDGVYLTWRDGGYVRSVTVATDSGAFVYDAGDLVQAQLFERGRFDATGIINVCGQNPFVYRIRLTADGVGRECEFEQYPMTAADFLSDKVFLKNSFISSVRDASDYVTEMYLQGVTSGRVYLSREVNASDIISEMEKCADRLRASAVVTENSDRILSVELGEYINAPSSVCSAATVQNLASLPHVEYNAQNRRPTKYVLNIDRQKRSVAVTGSEQLLYAVMNGIKPISSGVAGDIYGSARNVLLGIIGKDYDERDKAHAIYDWVQWSTRRVDEQSGDYADFLEGAFAIGGSSAAVTSMGAAKAFSLLCGMEGINTEIKCANGEYYNIVMIDGESYIVDVFGGEYVSGSSREIATHAGLFVRGLHETDGSFYTEKHIYNNEYFDYYISSVEADDYAAVKAAVDCAIDAQDGITSVTIRNAHGSSTFAYNDLNIEFCVSELNDDEFIRAAGLIARAIKENVGCDDGAIRINRYGDVLHLCVGSVRR